MEVDWSALDGAIGVAVIIIVIWVGLKLMKRLIVGVLLLLVIGVLFFGMHFGDIGIRG